MAKKDKKIKIPKSVEELGMSPKKFAKKHNIRIKGKGLSKGEKKRAKKKLNQERAEAAISGLDKAVKILSEHKEDNKKVLKVRNRVGEVITDPPIMKRVAKLYKKNPDQYRNMMFLPHMILTTIAYHNSEGISDEEKEVGKTLDVDGLLTFCEKILKDQTKRYRKLGINDSQTAFHMASTMPTSKVLKGNSRQWYNRLIQSLYQMAETTEVDLNLILPAVRAIDKKKAVSKEEFYQGFYSAFIWMKSSNKNHSFNDKQKDLHEALIERALEYLDGQKARKTKEILKGYIKQRKTAESHKNDNKRVIKFIDHANSNSAYTNLKSVIQELISDNSSNEAYLS